MESQVNFKYKSGSSDKLGDNLNANKYFNIFADLCDPRETLPCIDSNCTLVSMGLYNCKEAIELADASNYSLNRYSAVFIIMLFCVIFLFVFIALLLLLVSSYIKHNYQKFKEKLYLGYEINLDQNYEEQLPDN
jgi:hypothetical protein